MHLLISTFFFLLGDEYDIVLLSTVRSQPLSEISNEQLVQPDRGWLLENLGFLTDEHEINVGITRSKIGLIIVGEFCLNYIAIEQRFDSPWLVCVLCITYSQWA